MEGGFGPRIIFELPNGIPITETVTTTWVIMIGLTIFAWFAGKNFEKVPKGFQNFIELLVDGIYSLVGQTMGKDKMGFAPYIGTLLLFLVCANLAGLIGFRPPTADPNTTLGLALMTFFMIHFFGIKRKGLGYFKGFLEPMPVLLPINVIGELATPISLSFRLFGNIVGGMIIMSLLYGALGGLTQKLFGLGIPLLEAGIPAVFHIYFDVFSGVLQSFIFSMLTMVFVSGAMD